MLEGFARVRRGLRVLVGAVVMAVCLYSTSYAKAERYDLIYIWDTDLETVLDYKQELEDLFEEDIVKRLKIVGREGEYGVIFDTNGSARNVVKEMARQGEILRQAGLAEANGIMDEGYSQLYNVCYGLGPNVEALKERYHKLYGYLGEELGKKLLIEKTGYDNYTLIYRMRGNKGAATALAKKHAKLLKAKKVRTSITAENNNEVVYGESSLLDDIGETVAKEEVPVSAPAEPVKGPRPIVEATKVKKTRPVESTTVDIAPVLAPKAKLVAGNNAEVERQVAEMLRELQKKGALRGDEKSGWVVYDLQNDTTLVEINANELFQAASMIKPFVALAYFHQVKNGKLKYGSKARQNMEAMIQRSNNSATNWVMKQVGGPSKCEQILRQHYGHIFHRTIISEYIPAGGKTYRNSALPSDYARFLKALWRRELPYEKELRRVMALPGHDRLYDGTSLPRGTIVYNKTGSTARLCGDMGILVLKTRNGGRYPYAIVGIIERETKAADYGTWMKTRGNVIRRVSSLVYEGMKTNRNLL